ncbi:phosphomannomutase/phosphoglucomutase [Candidatus Dependentiae bacterium]
MQDSVFRKYDIRGKVGSEFDLDQVYDLARAIALYFVQQNPDVKTCAVGMDGRTHSPAVKKEICRALTDSGLDVMFVGTCPSPVLYFAMHNEPVQAGIMITASHNPGEYNGLKLCLGKESVWGDQVQEIKKLFHEKRFIEAQEKGLYTDRPMIDPYIDWFYNNVSHLVGSDISAVIDCGNGAAGTVLPQLIKKMDWQHVTLLFEEVDGTYPNHEADPTVEKNMQELKKVLAQGDAAFGLGLDGDCDRMAPMTKSGFLVPGDQLLAVFAQDLLQGNPGAAVVFDIKSSSGLIELLEQWGAKPCISPSGHSIIKKEMKKNNALLGGELSCHFVFNDRFFGFDDGIYAMVRLFEIIGKTDKPLDQLIAIFPKKFSSPEFRIACDDAVKWDIVENVKTAFKKRDDIDMITVDGVRASMPYGWGIVRASNTQPAISLRMESDFQDGLQRVKQDFFTAMVNYFDEKQLAKEMDL